MDLQRSGRRAFLRACWIAGTAVAALAGASTSAHAQEATTYSYDVLGRLVASTTSGGPNNGIATGTCFDPAGNRTQYVVAGAGAPCTIAPLATPLQTSLPEQQNAAPATPPAATSRPGAELIEATGE